MILVADSGSSKTDWRLILSEDKFEQFQSEGLNPNFHSASSIKEVLKNTFADVSLISKVSELHFYGAGCSSNESKVELKKAFNEFFPSAKVCVEHDLLGAARAACGHQAALAGILGTGSNCCVFDGTQIINSFPSGGYVIGDEGGGVQIGQMILKSYIEGYMPEELRERFDFRYKLSIDDILDNLYKKPYPNRFLAGFSRFAYQHKEDEFITDLLLKVFGSFFDQKVLRFSEANQLPLNLVGSIAYYYEEYIKAVAVAKGVIIGTILEKPIAGLALYHLYK